MAYLMMTLLSWKIDVFLLGILAVLYTSEAELSPDVDALQQEILNLRKELSSANSVVENLIEANKELRKDLQRARNFVCVGANDSDHAGHQGPPESVQAMSEADINGWDDQGDWMNEFVYGLPSSQHDTGDGKGGRKIVIELGANNGEWINGFLSMNPNFWPLIVEAQPSYRDTLREIAMEYRGIYLQKAAWVENTNLTFYGHKDAGGMGSSLFEDSVYHDGWCGGKLHCNESLGEAYQVEAVDMAEYVQRLVRREDQVVLRMDIEGAEYALARRLITTGVACDLIDYWEMEAHAMYAKQNFKYRPVDGVLPWLVRPCGVKMVTYQYYKADPKLVERMSESGRADGGARSSSGSESGCWAVDACPEIGRCDGISE